MDYFEPWLQFKQPCVRQLAFSLASPNIITTLPIELAIQQPFQLHSAQFWHTHFVNYLPRLKALDVQPAALLKFLQQLKSTRLGLRFEYLIYFWLLDDNYHAYKLLGHSMQQIQGKQTVGEVDFLVRNTSNNQTEHWEVALKYYLGEQNLTLPFWFGLNRNDTLQRKLTHFTRQQFRFEQINEHAIEQRFAVIKGQLYLPENLETHTNLDWIGSQRRMGVWGTQIKGSSYRRLGRHEWLCLHATEPQCISNWWTDGLYVNRNKPQHNYMYRPAPLLTLW